MKEWLNRAVGLLEASLQPPEHELNEIDWKVGLSPDKKRLVEHLSAFANYPGGGFLAYGVSDAGDSTPLSAKDVGDIVAQLANLGREALEPQLAIDHAIALRRGQSVLFIRIPESPVKPVHVRGKSLEHAFIRSGATTRQASRQEIGHMMLNSRTPRWEELNASPFLTDEQISAELLAEHILALLERPVPSDAEGRLAWLASEQFIRRAPSGGGYITNLGVIAAARDLGTFPDLSRKAVRVVVYEGTNKAKTLRETEGKRGYAVNFPGLLKHVMAQLPQSEVIEQALRVEKTVYPAIALRELIANALIHQDFSITGAGPLIEIFSNRIEIANPGGLLPSKQLDRLIGTQPESRNEALARAFRRYKICEERGSGLLKAGLEVELYGLPPMQFEARSNYFKVVLFAPRTFAEMSPKERLDACYQHAVLKYVSGSSMTNTTLRERLKMPERQRSMVSALIQEAVDSGRIKRSDPDSESKKFTKYIPFWA